MAGKQPTKRKSVTAVGRKTKGTFNSIVFSSNIGPSLYFDRQAFEGEEPDSIEIQVSWDSKQKPNHSAVTNTRQGEI